ncbi:hypothetical protein [Microbacterium sp. TPD7012]|uniref:hypothetical protein n=1 Tax=Microbacterium sp. TPD7012 TaxID=2171975 RepID=UPI000D520A4D|nr:hypothetical protein [Microbacterium sp. TPD7012]PVE94223.1 hypothetical protein DC434_15900 [Microbacterium sp. TPD7012]
MEKNQNRWRPPISIGWAALSVSVIIPLIVSVASWSQTRDLHCTADFSYTFAPLLVTCGARSTAVVVFGWAMTLATIGGLLLSAAMAIVAAIRATARPIETTAHAETWIFAITVVTVILAIIAAITTSPGGVASNAWILYSSAAAALILMTAAAIRPLVRRGVRNRA